MSALFVRGKLFTRKSFGLITFLCGAGLTIVALMESDAGPSTAVSQTFNYSGMTQTYSIPFNICSATITAKGAQGGSGSIGGAGGSGATVGAHVQIPANTLQVLVGGKGTDADGSTERAAGGFGGGGGGGDSTGGGGGGASTVTAFNASNSLLIVAGGGGGGNLTTAGGNGGILGSDASAGAGPGAGGGGTTAGNGGNGGFFIVDASGGGGGIGSGGSGANTGSANSGNGGGGSGSFGGGGGGAAVGTFAGTSGGNGDTGTGQGIDGGGNGDNSGGDGGGATDVIAAGGAGGGIGFGGGGGGNGGGGGGGYGAGGGGYQGGGGGSSFLVAGATNVAGPVPNAGNGAVTISYDTVADQCPAPSGQQWEVNANGSFIDHQIVNYFQMTDVENEKAGLHSSYLEGSITYRDSANRYSFTTTHITSVVAGANGATIMGTANTGFRQKTVSFTITVTANQTPATNDTFSITLSNGYSASGKLYSGSITTKTNQ